MTAMQPLVVSAADVSQMVARLWWPSLRIGGFVLAAPIASESTIPRRVKIVLTLVLAFLMAPLAPMPSGLSIFSGAGALTAAQEILIGVAIGLVMQLAFDALTFAGQTISMTMGLGFATLVDPQRGTNVTVIGQLFMFMGMLTYLAINGHLMLLGALANSFQSLPIGAANFDKGFLLSVATWGARIFETGLMVALPAVIALVIVNMALGVVTRAAPQLSLFGIGFTITMLFGFFVLIVGLDGVMAGISSLIDTALAAVMDLVGGSPPGGSPPGASAAGAH
jgi:flagellar biosynthesis protein FliR